jgi:hypothetical protein
VRLGCSRGNLQAHRLQAVICLLRCQKSAQIITRQVRSPIRIRSRAWQVHRLNQGSVTTVSNVSRHDTGLPRTAEPGGPPHTAKPSAIQATSRGRCLTKRGARSVGVDTHADCACRYLRHPSIGWLGPEPDTRPISALDPMQTLLGTLKRDLPVEASSPTRQRQRELNAINSPPGKPPDTPPDRAYRNSARGRSERRR